MSFRKLNELANKFEHKLAQQEQQAPAPIAESPFRTSAMQFFADLDVNGLGYLFTNPAPMQAAADIKNSLIDDNEIRSLIGRYVQRMQKQIDLLASFRGVAQGILSTK